eukprot:3254232-Heterocapsa_arctica.AAC.1
MTRSNLLMSSTEIGAAIQLLGTPLTKRMAPKPHGEASVVMTMSGLPETFSRAKTFRRAPR